MVNFIKEFFEIFNWRFWWFCFIAFFPLWVGIIGCIVVSIEQKLGWLDDDAS
jgi:hypothetical protein